MPARLPDPRDDGRPFHKEWHEFRASYAAARLHAWLLLEFRDTRPDYFRDLRQRLADAVTDGLNQRDAGEPDPGVPFPGPRGDPIRIWDLDLVETLRDHLFPFPDSEHDFATFAPGLLLVGFHAALEAYCQALGIGKSKTPLPLSIERSLAATGRTLHGSDARSLIECHQIRNIYVHSRGVVTDQYRDAVPYNTLQPGELRVVSQAELDRFAGVIWRVACAIRDALSTGGQAA